MEPTIQQQEARFQKACAIADAMVDAASSMCAIVGELAAVIPAPKTKRNIFLKAYNRRPDTKRKAQRIRVKASMHLLSAALGTARIAATPAPRFPSGMCGAAIEHPLVQACDANHIGKSISFPCSKEFADQLKKLTGGPIPQWEPLPAHLQIIAGTTMYHWPQK